MRRSHPPAVPTPHRPGGTVGSGGCGPSATPGRWRPARRAARAAAGALALAPWLALPGIARAQAVQGVPVAPTVYSQFASFQAATGATSASGAYAAGQAFLGAGWLGSVRVSAPSWLTVDWSTQLPGAEIAVSNGAGDTAVPHAFYNDGIDLAFATPVGAAGFDFHQPGGPGVIDGCNVNPCVASRFQMRLYRGADELAAFDWTPPVDARSFWGVHSPIAFDRLTVHETLGTDDNEFYGQIYTAAPVPEPARALLLLAGGLALLGARRRSPGG